MIRRHAAFDIAGRDRAFAFLAQRDRDFVAVVQLENDALQVQQQVDDVFLHAVDVEYSCTTPAIVTSVGA
jgi:hypothetical protein